MPIIAKFTKLMKGVKKKNNINVWVIDERKFLTDNEIVILREISKQLRIHGLNKKRFSPIRNWFMIELGLNAGLRVEEMSSLKHSNLIIDDTRSSIVVIGKGNKKRAVWINSEFKKKCQKFINVKKEFGYATDNEAFLLNNLKGDKISKRALQKFFKKILISASLPHHYSIHCLRHTYATFLLKASRYNYRFVQQQLGHSSIKTTQIYANILESEGKEALERLYM